MSDLIARLLVGTQVPEFETRVEAALEIERLRKALSDIRSRTSPSLDPKIWSIADQALRNSAHS